MKLALQHTNYDFFKPEGSNFEERISNFFDWVSARHKQDLYQYGRLLLDKAGPRARVEGVEAKDVVNFSSQDYLSLSSHPAVIEASIKAIHDHGIHSAGSPMILGNTVLTKKLEQEFRQFLDKEYFLFFPTGWAAGFGAVAGLVRKSDTIVMDRLSHASLQTAAQATGARIIKFEHLDHHSLESVLKDVRAHDVKNGIFVMTEGLFSMDSDSPDIRRTQDICHQYDALFFIDVAHDLGASGPNGLGQLGIQNALDHADIVMGSFSKTFATNGGFVATNSQKIYEYLRLYSNSYMFSNALSPVQAAIAHQCLLIVKSKEGEERRQSVNAVAAALRRELTDRGFECYGQTSPIVPVAIGDEKSARLTHRRIQKMGLAASIIEFPIVPLGKARFRLQCMATHTIDDVKRAAKMIDEARLL